MAIELRIQARHYATLREVIVDVAEGRITGISEPTAPLEDVAILRAGYVAPALFDLQINGAGGYGFTSPGLDVTHVRAIVATCRRHGIGALCPTLITSSFVNLAQSFATLRAAVEADADLAKALPVFHLEGPYLLPEDGPRGAHPRADVRPPDWEEWLRLQEAAGGRIRLVTLAPEWPEALPFIERLAASGVVVALGHTAAPPARIREAIRAGARLSTHLGNGCHALLPRHDNPLWEQLAADELHASIICDGHHLPSALVKTILRAKSPQHLVLTCDASPLAGMTPGNYELWGTQVEVLPEGKIVVAGTGYLAGSWSFIDTCIGNVMRYGGIPLVEAIAMASVRPRKLLGLPVATLGVGQPADLVLFDLLPGPEMRVRHVVIGGEVSSLQANR